MKCRRPRLDVKLLGFRTEVSSDKGSSDDGIRWDRDRRISQLTDT